MGLKAEGAETRRRDRDAVGVEVEGVGNGEGEREGGFPLPIRLRSLGERRELPSGAPADNEFGAFEGFQS